MTIPVSIGLFVLAGLREIGAGIWSGSGCGKAGRSATHPPGL